MTTPVERLEAATATTAATAATRRDERLSAAVAIIIAFTTLVAAVTGFLQADSANLAGDHRDQAEQLALSALASAQEAQGSSQVELETFQQWVEQRTQAGNAFLASLYAGSDPVRENELLLEQQRWETIAAATLRQSDIDPTSEFGPERDPTFPSRYFAAATQESARLNALQDAANEEAQKLDERAAGYTAILAMLAVALYLFGLTLAVLGRWLKLGFLGVGLSLLGVALLWIVQASALANYETNDEAASEYAAGRVAFETAHDPAGFQVAEAHYDRALELRPTFARAYSERASAIFLGASPQRSGLVSIVPPEALERARRDLDKAVALGLENASTLLSLGFYSFSQGVQSANVGLVNQSVEYSRRSIALDPGQPISRYNLGAALMAAGRFEEARAAYQDAVLRTIYVDAALTELRLEPFAEEQVVAGALTDLEIVRRNAARLEAATNRTGMEAAILDMKQMIVGRVAAESQDAPAASPAGFANITLDIFPAELQWQGTIDNYDETRDVISAQWYHDDAQDDGWAVIPEVSGNQKPPEDNGRRFQLTQYMSSVSPPACLPTGKYRIELYVNGRLAAEATADTTFADYEAFVARDITAGFCRPQEWTRREDRFPGLIDGFQSADKQSGAYAARYSLPGSLRGIGDISTQISDLTVQAFTDWFPAPPTFDHEDPDLYFMGLQKTAKRWYDYGSGSVLLGAGLTSDGAVILGMVYGPHDWFSVSEPYEIMNSMISLE